MSWVNSVDIVVRWCRCQVLELKRLASGASDTAAGSYRHLNWVERDRKPGDNIWGRGILRVCTLHTPETPEARRNVFMTRRSDQQRFSVSALIITKTNLFFQNQNIRIDDNWLKRKNILTIKYKTRMKTSISSKAICSITDRQTDKIFTE